MNIILILACFATFYNIKIIGYNKDYLSVRQTENLKGIFIVLVLFHHLNIFAGVGDVYNIFMNAGILLLEASYLFPDMVLCINLPIRAVSMSKIFLKRGFSQ